MDEREVRLRCVEAASRHSWLHKEGPVVGLLEAAKSWSDWVISGNRPPDEEKELGVFKSIQGLM